MICRFSALAIFISLAGLGCDTGGGAQSGEADATVRADMGMPMCGTPEYMCPAGQECRLGTCVQTGLRRCPRPARWSLWLG